jgi:hypothetical protein
MKINKEDKIIEIEKSDTYKSIGKIYKDIDENHKDINPFKVNDPGWTMSDDIDRSKIINLS